ncbi:MAG TPA: pilus assembly protein TadG-related protein [Polyangia bacterium]|nr:pilus assembly protein TadG-related protein [Polyangia bacterium]
MQVRTQVRRRSPERGAMVVVMAITLAVVMGFAALAFDLAYVRLARMQMQNATDAAAHAAMHKYRMKQPDQTAAVATAKAVAAANTVLGNSVTLLDSDIVFGVWDTRYYPSTTFSPTTVDPNAITINGRISDPKASAGSVDTTFGKVIGFTQASVARSGIAAFRTRGIEIGLDVTGSFIYPAADPPVYQARTAALNFLDAMHDMNVTGDRIGMQLFTGKAQQVTPIQSVKDNYNSISDAWKKVHICQKPGYGGWPPAPQGPDDPLMPLCWARDDGMAYPTPGPTSNPGAVLKAAGAQLLASPSPYEMPIVVLITDGEPMCCTHESGGNLCSKVPPGAPCCESGVICTAATDVCNCAKGLRDAGIAQANALYSSGISIFTISYIDPGMDPDRKAAVIDYNADLTRGIGKAYDSPVAADIGKALTEIANSIPITLVK